MVLELKDICLNYIAKNFSVINNFNHTLLSSTQKEIIIERLVNHNWLYLLPSSSNIQSIESYQRSLVKYFFNGHLNAITFNDCNQLNDIFIQLITQLVSSDDLEIKSLAIIKCIKVTGKYFSSRTIININLTIIIQFYFYLSNKDVGISTFLSKYSKNLEQITLNYLNFPLSMTLCNTIRSLRLIKIDLSFCFSITDNGYHIFIMLIINLYLENIFLFKI
jgi:hypothetical protein